MSGLLSRSHVNAGQDGFRDASSKNPNDLWRPAESTESLASWIDRSHHLLVALQVLRVAIIHDNTTYSQGLNEETRKTWEDLPEGYPQSPPYKWFRSADGELQHFAWFDRASLGKSGKPCLWRSHWNFERS